MNRRLFVLSELLRDAEKNEVNAAMMAGYTFLKSGEKKLDDKYYQTFKGKDV